MCIMMIMVYFLIHTPPTDYFTIKSHEFSVISNHRINMHTHAASNSTHNIFLHVNHLINNEWRRPTKQAANGDVARIQTQTERV